MKMKKTLHLAVLAASLLCVSAPGLAQELPEITASIGEEGEISFSKAGISQESTVIATRQETSVFDIGDQFAVATTSEPGESGNAAVVSTTAGALATWNFPEGTSIAISINNQNIGLVFESVGTVQLPLEDSVESQLVLKASKLLENGIVSTSESAISFSASSVIASGSIQAMLASAPALPSKTTLRYLTFIGGGTVPAPIVGCLPPSVRVAGYDVVRMVFLGNNRTFGPGNTDNKTSLQVNVDWLAGTTTTSKSAAPTVAQYYYAFNPTPLTLELTANTSEIYALTSSQTNSSVNLHMHHEAGNPFCAAYPIFYDVRGQIYRNGNYTLHGEFRQVPNHEFYIKSNLESSWNIIYRSQINQDWNFYCLTPLISFCIVSDRWTQGNRATWYQ
jgi:hypothetical protein